MISRISERQGQAQNPGQTDELEAEIMAHLKRMDAEIGAAGDCRHDGTSAIGGDPRCLREEAAYSPTCPRGPSPLGVRRSPATGRADSVQAPDRGLGSMAAGRRRERAIV